MNTTIENTQAAQSAQPVRFLCPRANVTETKDAYHITAEMPGVAKAGLEVTVEKDELILVGHRTGDKPPGEPLYRESRPHDYRRVFDLDPRIDRTKILARIEHGVLEVTLPKAEEVKPRRIEIAD